EVGAIEKIECFGAELNAPLFTQSEGPGQREINTSVIRPGQNVSAGCSVKTYFRWCESHWIKPKVGGASAGGIQIDPGDQVGPRGVVICCIAVRVAINQHAERHARTERHDGVDLPITKSATQDAFEVIPKGQIVRDVSDEGMLHIEIRTGTVQTPVIRIERPCLAVAKFLTAGNPRAFIHRFAEGI